MSGKTVRNMQEILNVIAGKVVQVGVSILYIYRYKAAQSYNKASLNKSLDYS